MKHLFPAAFLFIFCLISANLEGQDKFRPTIPKMTEFQGDSIRTFALNDIFVYPPQAFTDQKEAQKYLKLIRDVKKTLPYAKLIYGTLIETYEFIETLPTEQAREAHLKRMENDLFDEYKPVLKKMTLSQGKLLIKLIDRECNQTSYDLLKAFLGPVRAGFWNLFAGMFGASLKSTWEPEGKDAATERVVELVEMGLL
jgi:hypothetical protein